MKRMAVVAFVVVAGVAAVLLWPDRRPGDGPLDDGDGFVMSQPADVGQVISFGHIALSNYGNKPATVERVRVVGVTGPLELVGLQARPFPNPQGDFLNEYGFPPAGFPGRPIAEENLIPVPKRFNPEGEPIEALQLVIGVKATAPGVARARGVEVTYTVGETRHREVFLNEFYLCAPLNQYRTDDGSGCPPPELEHQFDDRVLEAR